MVQFQYQEPATAVPTSEEITLEEPVKKTRKRAALTTPKAPRSRTKKAAEETVTEEVVAQPYHYDAYAFEEALNAMTSGVLQTSETYKSGIIAIKDFAINMIGMKDPSIYQNTVKIDTASNDGKSKIYRFVLSEADFDVLKWCDEMKELGVSKEGWSFQKTFKETIFAPDFNPNWTPPHRYRDSSISEVEKDPRTHITHHAMAFGKYFSFQGMKEGINTIADMCKSNAYLKNSRFGSPRKDNLWLVVIEKVIPKSSSSTYPKFVLTCVSSISNGHSEQVEIYDTPDNAETMYLKVSQRASSFVNYHRFASNSGDGPSLTVNRYIRKQYLEDNRQIMKMIEYQNGFSQIAKEQKRLLEVVKKAMNTNKPVSLEFMYADPQNKPRDAMSMGNEIYFKRAYDNVWLRLTSTGLDSVKSSECRLLESVCKIKKQPPKLLRQFNTMMYNYLHYNHGMQLREYIKKQEKVRREITAPRFKEKLWKDAGFTVRKVSENQYTIGYLIKGYQFLDKFFVPIAVQMTMDWYIEECAFSNWKCTSPDIPNGRWHPHIKNGDVCTGTYGKPIREAIMAGQPQQVIAELMNFLNSYDLNREYRSIEQCGKLPYSTVDDRGFPIMVSHVEVEKHYQDVYSVNTIFSDGSRPYRNDGHGDTYEADKKAAEKARKDLDKVAVATATATAPF